MNCRMILATTTGCLVGLALASPAAADWREEYPTITLVRALSETDAQRREMFETITDWLSERLGVEVQFRVTSEHAASVEALLNGHAEIARTGPQGYAIAHEQSEGAVQPIASELNEDGSYGYSSIIAVRADSEIHSLEDLEGRSIAFASPSSNSGYVAPMYFLMQEGIDPDSFFGNQAFAGNHENAVFAMLNGTFDAAATWAASEAVGVPARMEAQGLIDQQDLRIVWTSDIMPRGVYIVRSDLPEDMQRDIAEAILALPEEAPDVWQAATDGTNAGLKPVTHEDYLDIIEMRDFTVRMLSGG